MGGNPESGGMGGNPESGGMGGGMGSLYEGGGGGMSGPVPLAEGEPIETIYLKLRAKNVLPRERETLNREYSHLVAKLFRDSELFSDSEDDTKVIGTIPSIDSNERWFDFVLQLKLNQPIIMQDKELE